MFFVSCTTRATSTLLAMLLDCGRSTTWNIFQPCLLRQRAIWTRCNRWVLGSSDGAIGFSAPYLSNPQRHDVQPDVYCRSLGLAVPISISLKDRFTADVYNLLVGVAMDPTVAIPAFRKSSGQGSLMKYITVGAAVGAIVALAFLGYRLFARR